MKKQFKIHNFSPLVDFTYLLFKYPIHLKYFPRIILYYLKFVFFEPFRLLEKYKYQHEMENYQFKTEPIFILGYYRSGTTYLQEILLEDKRFGYMNFFQCFFSSGFLITERYFKNIFQKIINLIHFKHPAHQIPFHFDMPGEDDVAMVSSGYRHASNWGQIFVNQFEDFFEESVFFKNCSFEVWENFKENFRSLLIRVSIANNNRQLLLKSPPHTARIAFLKETFPKAKFIFIRRNLYLTYKSNQKLWTSFYDLCLQGFNSETANEKILWSMNKCFECLEIQKNNISDNDFIEISYEELLKDPVLTLENIYARLEIDGFLQVKSAFTAYAEKHHGANIAKHGCTEKDFQAVEKALSRWLKHWNYTRPV
jgi:hypothetical protein